MCVNLTCLYVCNVRLDLELINFRVVYVIWMFCYVFSHIGEKSAISALSAISAQ